MKRGAVHPARGATRLRARVATAALALAAAVALPRVGRAQQPPRPGPVTASEPAGESADELIRRGVELRTARRDAEALELFARAWAIDHSPRARAQIGLAEQAMGRWLDAEAHVAEALEAASDPWIARNRAALESARAAIARRLSTLELQDGVAGAQVRINGEPAGALPLARPVRVVAGTVLVEARAPGYRVYRREVVVEAGVPSRESLRMIPLEAEEPDAAARVGAVSASRRGAGVGARTNTHRSFVALGGVGIAVGGAALAGGVVAHAVREGAAARWNDDATCLPLDGRSRGEGCPGELATIETASPLAIAGYVVGGALVTAGAVMLAVGLGAPPRERASARGGSRAGVRIGCAPDVSRLGAVCAGAF